MATALDAYSIAKASKEAEQVWMERCSNRCWVVGAVRLRGKTVYGVRMVKLSAPMQASLSLPRRIEARSWIGSPPTELVLVGCEHGLAYVNLTTDGCRVVEKIGGDLNLKHQLPWN